MKWLAALVILMSQIAYNAPALAHDPDPDITEWMSGLQRPDMMGSCCGKADAYWCDSLSVENGKVYCTITDDRVVPGRPPVPVGTKIEIPRSKLKWDKGNPTGHAVVFYSASTQTVFCFVQNEGT